MKKTLIAFVNSLATAKETNDFRLNKMLCALFEGKKTVESIELFAELKQRFEKELKERNLNAMIENSDIDSYFKNTKEIEVTL